MQGVLKGTLYFTKYKLETDLEQIFNLNKDQILVAADKNMGYVCIDTTDLLQ